MVGSFEGNLWTGEAKNGVAGFFLDGCPRVRFPAAHHCFQTMQSLNERRKPPEIIMRMRPPMRL